MAAGRGPSPRRADITMAKVLVLEDDRLAQKIVGTVLSKAGHETVSADSTTNAWSKLQEHVLVDMVVVDNQLDQEWGWQFLRMIRQHPAYRGLPVIVYSAHTERESVVRYLELGVQSLHVKPYQSDVLLAELAKAVDTKWTTQVMETPEVICARLGLSMSEYGGVLAAATRSIEEGLKVVQRHLTSASDPHLISALESIRQQSHAVGINIIDGVMDKILDRLREEDFAGVFEGLGVVKSLLGMIRHRMLSVLKMNGSVAHTALPVIPSTAGAEAEAVAPAASFVAAYARDIIGKPLWQYGPLLKRAMRRPLVTPEELQATIARLGPVAPFSAVTDSLRLLQAVPKMGLDEAAAAARDTPGFLPVYRQVLERVSGTDRRLDSAAAISQVVSQEGVAKVMSIVAVARVTGRLPKGGPLNLRPLYAHTLATALTAFEIGRLLTLENDHMLTAAGLMYDSGRWLFAIGEPGIYALALALAEGDHTSLEQAETALFGLDHHQAGRQMLAALGQPTLVQDAAALHHDPSKVTEPESQITVNVIHLAHLLAQAAAAAAPDAKEILDRLRASNYPAWALLKSRGVTLPFDPPEMVDTLMAISSTSHWTAHQLLARL